MMDVDPCQVAVPDDSENWLGELETLNPGNGILFRYKHRLPDGRMRQLAHMTLYWTLPQVLNPRWGIVIPPQPRLRFNNGPEQGEWFIMEDAEIRAKFRWNAEEGYWHHFHFRRTRDARGKEFQVWHGRKTERSYINPHTRLNEPYALHDIWIEPVGHRMYL